MYRENKRPGVAGVLLTRSESHLMGKYEAEEAHKVSGEDSEERTNPRRAFGSLSGS